MRLSGMRRPRLLGRILIITTLLITTTVIHIKSGLGFTTINAASYVFTVGSGTYSCDYLGLNAAIKDASVSQGTLVNFDPTCTHIYFGNVVKFVQ
jgi:hypothetical protein